MRERDGDVVEPVVQHLSRARGRRRPGHPPPRHAGAEGGLSAEPDQRPVGRHDEPHRAALRHRSGTDADPGGAARRRRLRDHRHQDVHHRRRARPDREHRPPRAGQDFRRARGYPRDQPVHRAQVPGRRGRRARRAQPPALRLDRAQDGPQRLGDLRDGLRGGDRIPPRRGAQGHARDVHDDERGPSGGRRPGAVPVGDRLSERRGLRQGAAPGTRAARTRRARGSGRSDHRPPRCPPHAHVDARVQRRRARPRPVDRLCTSISPPAIPTRAPAATRKSWGRC